VKEIVADQSRNAFWRDLLPDSCRIRERLQSPVMAGSTVRTYTQSRRRLFRRWPTLTHVPLPFTPVQMHRHRVLVVDDEPAIRHAFALLLARHGFEAHTVSTRDEAHAFLAEHRVDALVLDLRLRGSAPGDVIFREAIARDPSLKSRTAFITGDISSEARDRVIACGCPYLMKPFDAQLFVDTVRALCGVIAPAVAAAPSARAVEAPAASSSTAA
jgi:CheY-like chemotaxis protein